MSSKRERDYIAKHQLIMDKLVELSSESERACFDVARLASRLGMDIRTVRAHLKIMEVDSVGIFMDAGEKQFCTKEGITMLSNMLSSKRKPVD